MDRQALTWVLEALISRGVMQGHVSSCGDDYLSISCPFADRRHERGTDRRPSATAEISTEGPSVVRCHMCHYRNTLLEMLHDINAIHEGAISDIVETAKEMESSARFPIKPRSKQDVYRPEDYTTELRKRRKVQFPDEAVEFLRSKGCSMEIVKKMGCAWIAHETLRKWDGEPYDVRNAVLIPTMIREGRNLKCVGAKAREIEQSRGRSKYFTFFKFQAGRHLFGEHLLNRASGQRILLVEGEFDAMHLLELGELAFGLMGTYGGEERVQKIRLAAPRVVYLLLDPDSAGRRAAPKLETKLREMGLTVIRKEPEKDPKHLTVDDLRDLCGFTRR